MPTLIKGVTSMSLVKCKKCNYEVLPSTKTCPECGSKEPGFKLKNKVISLSVFVFVVFLLVQCTNDDTETNKQQTQLTIDYGNNAIDWQKAAYNDRLSFCKDIVERAWRKSLFTAAIQDDLNTVNSLPEELLTELNIAFKAGDTVGINEQIYANQIIGDTAILLMTMKGWLK